MNKPPQILVFIDWYLPGFRAGGPIRSVANMVEQMGGDYKFTIATRNTDYLQKEPYAAIASDSVQSTAAGNVIYLSAGNLRAATIKELVQSAQHQIIYINGIYSWYFSILPAWYAKLSNKKVIIAPRGMLAKSAITIKPLKKRLFLAMSRILGLYKNPNLTFHATTSREADDIRTRLNVKAKIVCAGNFPKVIPSNTKVSKQPGRLKMFCIARVAPEKNIAFAVKCLSNLPSEVQVTYNIYGEIYDASYAEICLNIAKRLPPNIQVHFCGSIAPEKIVDVFESHHLFFLPTLGENFGHAIIEALLAGIPALISDQTPWQNLSLQALGAAINLSHPQEFVKMILHYAALDDVEYKWLRESIRENAAKLIHLSETKNKYSQLFEEA